MPAKWRSPLVGSTARLIRVQDKGYIIDIDGFDREKMTAALAKEGFRSALLKAVLPWAWNHPAGRPRRCWGVALGQGLADDHLQASLGAVLHYFTPKKLI